jgi:hypothetical protein
MAIDANHVGLEEQRASTKEGEPGLQTGGGAEEKAAGDYNDTRHQKGEAPALPAVPHQSKGMTR